MNKKIVVFTGDPNSINSELIYKCWKKLNNNTKKRIYFISNLKLLKSQFKKLNYKLKAIRVKNIKEAENLNLIKIIDININFKDPFKIKKHITSNYVKSSLELLHKMGCSKNVAGVINLPISKNLLSQKNIGVTEYLASKCKIKNGSEAMLIHNDNFSVSPVSTHIDLRKVTMKINKTLIINKVTTIQNFLKKFLKRKPKIGILGLNPHNAELRAKSEERKIIIPSIKKLKKKEFNIKGPLVADTVFIDEYNNFDVIVGMYHDQVLAPFKSLFKFNAINITLGLNYIRVSPDHGVAINLIGKNKANITSISKCFDFIKKLK